MSAASPFRERVARALADETLHVALGRATGQLQSRRDVAFASLDDADAVRDFARAGKLAATRALDRMLEEFERRLIANGVVVHWARDAEEACATIVDIARARGCRRAVKGKSMATEEIELNAALQAAGITVVESDLGEFVVQLDRDRPSHIILPILHRTREQVGRIFERELAVDYTPDPAELCRIARARLRDEFLAADIGITGANFGVVETGSLCIVSNEGNVRMSSSLPRVHVALLGIDKLLPTLDHLDAALKVLARSATGQKSTVYVSLVHGPRRAPAEVAPEELHVLLLDHGRTKVLAGEAAEMFACIRCGACLNACPVFQQVGGHAYASIYPGPMGSVLTPVMRGLADHAELPQASSLCGACRDACPVKIDLPRMLLALRRESVATLPQPLALRIALRAWSFVMARPWLHRVARRLARAVARRAAPDGWLRRAPGLLSNWTATRDLKAPSARSFDEWWRNRGAPR
ncbi:MAG: lactate utilization protein [Planctomycetes bacterium]|nr:lactate utilization protein [Planctomycetota bacterium]